MPYSTFFFFFYAQTVIARALQNCLPDPQQEYIRVSSAEVNQQVLSEELTQLVLLSPNSKFLVIVQQIKTNFNCMNLKDLGSLYLQVISQSIKKV